MMRHLLITLFSVLAISTTWAAAPGSYPGDPFADRVATRSLGSGGGYGENYLPDNVLGPPHGNVNTRQPEDSENHLLSLGDGGSIVLEFANNVCVDEPGPDLVIFENVFADDSDMNGSFYIETATVAVSEDGVTYYSFPFNFNKQLAEDTKIGTRYFYTPQLYSGLAGVHPTLASYENGVSPVNPAVSGGDFFDLADVGLARCRFVKITDTGRPGTSTEALDGDGEAVYDTGNGSYDPTLKKFGFDLDAVAAIHSAEMAAAQKGWMLYD